MDKKMKILHVNNYFCKEGGAEKVMYETCLELQKNGREVFYYATDKRPFFEPDYKYKEFFPKYVEYKSLSKIEIIKNFSRPFYNFEAKIKFEKYLQVIKPDIVHFHNIYYHLSPSVLDVCKKNRIPCVMTLHDIRLICPACSLLLNNEDYCKEELCVKGNSIHCVLNKCKNKNLAASCVVAAEFFINRIAKTYENVDFFICATMPTLELAERSGIRKEKLKLLPNFINDEMFKIKPESENGNYFLFAGRLIKDKGLDFFLETVKELPEIDFKILGAGDYELELKKQAKDLSLQNVEFLGYKTGNELEDYFKFCIAGILPSKWFETFGMTVIELFLYGKPSIVSDRGGIKDIVNDGEDGIIFEYGNKERFKNAILKLYNNPDVAREMGIRGRLKIESNYNSTNYIKNLLDIYNYAALKSMYTNH